MGGPHAHDEKPKKEAKVDDADKEKEEYSAKMAKKEPLYQKDSSKVLKQTQDTNL